MKWRKKNWRHFLLQFSIWYILEYSIQLVLFYSNNLVGDPEPVATLVKKKNSSAKLIF